MIKLLNICISKIKGQKYELNKHLTFGYVFHICLIRFIQIMRGFLRIKKFPVFVGKNVQIRGKKYLHVGKGTTIDDNVCIDAFSEEGVILGENVKIGSNSIVSGSGSLQISGKGLRIGNNSSTGEFSYFGCAGGINIGDNVIMGQNIRFHAQNHNFNSLQSLIKDQGVFQTGIKIKDNCWIGSGSVFLDGVVVGQGVVIGANTLVNKDIPDNSVAVGNPVKILKKRGI